MRNRGKPRPPFLRALGKHDPPLSIQLGDEVLSREEIFKHDSWAATALYASADQKVVCKFNRQHPLCGMPMGWLGRWLARREFAHFQRLQGIAGIPRLQGCVAVDGNIAKHAVAHEFIAGNPLPNNQPISIEFDAQLAELMERVHQRELAYVDFHKRENIIVGADGRPYLIDFQVSWMASPKKNFLSLPRRWILRQLQAMDRYHLSMHQAHHVRLRGEAYCEPQRPWWIRLHRKITRPIRQSRRWILVKLGIRAGNGLASSEHCPEQAFR